MFKIQSLDLDLNIDLNLNVPTKLILVLTISKRKVGKIPFSLNKSNPFHSEPNVITL